VLLLKCNKNEIIGNQTLKDRVEIKVKVELTGQIKRAEEVLVVMIVATQEKKGKEPVLKIERDQESGEMEEMMGKFKVTLDQELRREMAVKERVIDNPKTQLLRTKKSSVTSMVNEKIKRKFYQFMMLSLLVK
jgi:hypothetical protein